jgi:hypothetical protein
LATRIIKVTLGSETGSDEVPIAGVHSVMLRQIGYEILHSPVLLDLAAPKTIGTHRRPDERPGRRGSTQRYE